MDFTDGICVNPTESDVVITQALREPPVKLYDPNIPDRFTLIATPKSILTKKFINVYHDKKYDDLIYIPDIGNIVNADSYQGLLGTEIMVDGNTIGTTKHEYTHLTKTNTNAETVAIKDTPTPVTTKTHIRPIISETSSFTVTEYNLRSEGVEIGNSVKLKPLQLVSLGATDACIGDTKVPMYHYINTQVSTDSLLYNGMYKPAELVFPLYF
jgi:hypothetical protein